MLYDILHYLCITSPDIIFDSSFYMYVCFVNSHNRTYKSKIYCFFSCFVFCFGGGMIYNNLLLSRPVSINNTDIVSYSVIWALVFCTKFKYLVRYKLFMLLIDTLIVVSWVRGMVYTMKHSESASPDSTLQMLILGTFSGCSADFLNKIEKNILDIKDKSKFSSIGLKTSFFLCFIYWILRGCYCTMYFNFIFNLFPFFHLDHDIDLIPTLTHHNISLTTSSTYYYCNIHPELLYDQSTPIHHQNVFQIFSSDQAQILISIILLLWTYIFTLFNVNIDFCFIFEFIFKMISSLLSIFFDVYEITDFKNCKSDVEYSTDGHIIHSSSPPNYSIVQDDKKKDK